MPSPLTPMEVAAFYGARNALLGKSLASYVRKGDAEIIAVLEDTGTILAKGFVKKADKLPNLVRKGIPIPARFLTDIAPAGSGLRQWVLNTLAGVTIPAEMKRNPQSIVLYLIDYLFSHGLQQQVGA